MKSNAAKKNWNPYLSRSAVRQDLDYGGGRRRHEALGSYPHAITSIGRLIERQATHPRYKAGIAARSYQCRRRHAGGSSGSVCYALLLLDLIMDHLSATESLNGMEMSRTSISVKQSHVLFMIKSSKSWKRRLRRVNGSASLVNLFPSFTLQGFVPEPSTTS